MMTWRSIHTFVPWLRQAPPYFVHELEEEGLRTNLQLAGFRLVTVKGAAVKDETDLLRQLGHALEFPEYYGANWDAFSDCAGDMAHQGKPIGLIWTDSDHLLSRDIYAFVRAVHQLLSISSGLGSPEDPFQFEVFFVGNCDVFRNISVSPPSPQGNPL